MAKLLGTTEPENLPSSGEEWDWDDLEYTVHSFAGTQRCIVGIAYEGFKLYIEFDSYAEFRDSVPIPTDEELS